MKRARVLVGSGLVGMVVAANLPLAAEGEPLASVEPTPSAEAVDRSAELMALSDDALRAELESLHARMPLPGGEREALTRYAERRHYRELLRELVARANSGRLGDVAEVPSPLADGPVSAPSAQAASATGGVEAIPRACMKKIVVSVTFDDGLDTYEVPTASEKRDKENDISFHALTGGLWRRGPDSDGGIDPIRATYFVNRPRINHGGGFDWNRLSLVAQYGHEIGGHSAHHLNLPRTYLDHGGADEVRRQVCWDRYELTRMQLVDPTAGYEVWEMQVLGFAYPFGETSADVTDIVGAARPTFNGAYAGDACGGYLYARATTGVGDTPLCRSGSAACPWGAVLPYSEDPDAGPAYKGRFAIPTPSSLGDGFPVGPTSLAELADASVAARAGSAAGVVYNAVQAACSADSEAAVHGAGITTAEAAASDFSNTWWIPLVFHKLCKTEPCSPYGIVDDDFVRLMDFLRDRRAAGEVRLLAMGEALKAYHDQDEYPYFNDMLWPERPPWDGNNIASVLLDSGPNDGGVSNGELDAAIPDGGTGSIECFEATGNATGTAFSTSLPTAGGTPRVARFRVQSGSGSFYLRGDANACALKAVPDQTYRVSFQFRRHYDEATGTYAAAPAPGVKLEVRVDIRTNMYKPASPYGYTYFVPAPDERDGFYRGVTDNEISNAYDGGLANPQQKRVLPAPTSAWQLAEVAFKVTTTSGDAGELAKDALVFGIESNGAADLDVDGFRIEEVSP